MGRLSKQISFFMRSGSRKNKLEKKNIVRFMAIFGLRQMLNVHFVLFFGSCSGFPQVGGGGKKRGEKKLIFLLVKFIWGRGIIHSLEQVKGSNENPN